MPSDSEKRQFSWRGFNKISAKLPILHALRHVCGIGVHTRTEKCLWRFSLQMHCNVSFSCGKAEQQENTSVLKRLPKNYNFEPILDLLDLVLLDLVSAKSGLLC